YSPDNSVAFANRGEVYLALDKPAQALTDFHKANVIKPNTQFALAGLALAYFELGESDKAIEIWQRLSDIDQRFNDVDWAAQQLNWHEVLIEKARKFVN